jgi:membrane fusion protein, heavy metal efflux system
MSHWGFQRIRRVMAIAVVAGCIAPAVLAGPGHDHSHGGGHDHETVGRHLDPVSPRAAMVSEDYELVAILKDHRLLIYLDRRQDLSPVHDAKIDMTVNGAVIPVKPHPNGTYVAEHQMLQAHEAFQLVAAITEGPRQDLLAGLLDATLPAADRSDAAKFGHGHDFHHVDETGYSGAIARLRHEASHRPLVVFVGGLVVGAVLALLFRSRAAASLAVLAVVFGATLPDTATAGPGHDHGHDSEQTLGGGLSGDAPRRLPNNVLFIPKPTQRLLEIRTRKVTPQTVERTQPLIGRVIADPNRNGLVQSTIRGRIKPTERGLPVLGQAVTAGETLAQVEPAFAPIDASDVRQTAGDLEQRIAVLKARLARRQQLVDRKVASRASLQDIEIELKGLETRRRQLDASSIRPEALVAPVSGVVANVRVVAGQVIDSADTLFQIIDPESLWIEAIAFDPTLAVDAAAKAYSGDNQPLELEFVGRSRTLQQQATVLQYRIKKPPQTLNIGEPVSLSVATGDPVTGLIIPKDAVAEAPNGQTVAFVRQSPEKYRAVAIRTEVIDGTRLHVLAGLKPGDQIIVRGASLVNQIR